jgi:hypothetical protein
VAAWVAPNKTSSAKAKIPSTTLSSSHKSANELNVPAGLNYPQNDRKDKNATNAEKDPTVANVTKVQNTWETLQVHPVLVLQSISTQLVWNSTTSTVPVHILIFSYRRNDHQWVPA